MAPVPDETLMLGYARGIRPEVFLLGICACAVVMPDVIADWAHDHLGIYVGGVGVMAIISAGIVGMIGVTTVFESVVWPFPIFMLVFVWGFRFLMQLVMGVLGFKE